MIILIDAGHGIETFGKRSPDGLFLEYLWNRQVADLVLSDLIARKIDARLVVTETNDIPLRTRVNRINSVCSLVGANNVLLISIHSNASGNGKNWQNAVGWSCYTTKGKTRSDEVAECFYDSFEAEFKDRKIRRDRSDGDRDWESNFYIIEKTRCPSVLLENFFYDNREECAWLLLEETKKRIASAIVEGLLIYLSNCFI